MWATRSSASAVGDSSTPLITVDYTHDAVLLNLEMIRDWYTLGSNAGADKIIGTNESNRILANGHDQVFAGDGVDVITLTENASVDGEGGQDVYLVQRGLGNAEIKENGADVSVIRLEYAIKEIKDWQLKGKDLVISFAVNGQNKQLTVRDVYQENNGQFTLVNDKLSFQTKDGLMLIPQFEKTFSAEDAAQYQSITFTTRYLKSADKTYRDIENGVTIDLNKNTVDGPNEGGVHKYFELSKLDKSTVSVVEVGDRVRGELKNDGAFVERSKIRRKKMSFLTLNPEENPSEHVKTIFLDYDSSEIRRMHTRYGVRGLDLNGPEVKAYESTQPKNLHRYNSETQEWEPLNKPTRIAFERVDYSLVLTMKNGHRVVLEDIKANSSHFWNDNTWEYTHLGGEQLWDYEIITRDGIKINSGSLATWNISGDKNLRFRRRPAIRKVTTTHTHPREDLTLADWQWGQGRQLDNRYQLTAEGTAYDDTLIGDDKANVIRGYGGHDYFEGNNGHDTYVIGALKGEVYINNLAEDKKLDSVVVATSINDISTYREGINLVLTAQLSQPTEDGSTLSVNREIILENYFVSETFRHIGIVTNEGHQQQIIIDDGGMSRLIIASDSANGPVVVTELLGNLTNLQLAREGNDLHAVIVSESESDSDVVLTEVVFQNFYQGAAYQQILLGNGQLIPIMVNNL
ncbi:hypothetical protein [Spartinivicinus poritis]|uniref:Uncharacterized protein n=1 Tax=Spartinivicinus poritis TaxID=2994640 RepID=A0ABT5UI72_9GAMM|nr:hypothetical protein [Spartinivicinus sp. A2-2]MDE1466089.1 hypothetical protein [Spartinivicinus sp. A2-2]